MRLMVCGMSNNWGFREAPKFNYILTRERKQLQLKIDDSWMNKILSENQVIVSDNLN